MRREHAKSLEGHLYRDHLARLIKTRLFGGPYVELGPFIELAFMLYVTGAVLGRALRDRAHTLVSMFSQLGAEHQVLQYYSGLAQRRLQDYGKEPTSFIDLIRVTEYAKANVHYPPRSRADLKAFTAAAKKKLPLEEAEPMAGSLFVREGVAFGMNFPELTEKLYRSTFEHIDTKAWAEAQAAGLDIPEHPVPVTLEEVERDVLAEVAQYVRIRHPKLAAQLGLQGQDMQI